MDDIEHSISMDGAVCPFTKGQDDCERDIDYGGVAQNMKTIAEPRRESLLISDKVRGLP